MRSHSSCRSTAPSARWPATTTRTATSTAVSYFPNYNNGPDKAIFVPDFLMKTWERSGPPVMILYNTLHSKPAKR